MAARLSVNEKGETEMFSGSDTIPWHGQGQIVQGLATSREALELAKLAWQVRKANIKVNDVIVPDYCANVREDNQKVLGIVKNRYRIIQNLEAFEFFDSVIGEGQAVYDTAGALCDGKIVWLLAKLPKTLFLKNNPNDKIDQYVLMSKGHDGERPLNLKCVATRVVCHNTISIAWREQGNEISIRHSENYKSKMEAAQLALNFTSAYFGNLQGVIDTLSTISMNKKQMENFSELLLPSNDETEVSTRKEKIRSNVVELFSNGNGNNGETRWDAFNAVTDYVDHFQKIRETTSRMKSVFFGQGQQLKQRASNLLLDRKQNFDSVVLAN